MDLTRYSELRVDIIVKTPFSREVHEQLEGMDFKVKAASRDKTAIKYRSCFEAVGEADAIEVTKWIEELNLDADILVALVGKPIKETEE